MSKNGNAIHGIFFPSEIWAIQIQCKKNNRCLLINKCVSIGSNVATLAANGGSLEPNHSTPTAQRVQGLRGLKKNATGGWPW